MKKYCVFFIDRKDADLSSWTEPIQGPFEYDMIDMHRNEWYDLLHDRYEMWICDNSSKKRMKDRIKAELVLEEIKNDFAEDGEYVRLSHKYYGRWLVVRLVSIDEELPALGNCEYVVTGDGSEPQDSCDKAESPKTDYDLFSYSDYVYLCDEHKKMLLSELSSGYEK
jgi:hypothetical protein